MQSIRRLGKGLTGLLMHRGEDLLRPDADAIWHSLERFARDSGLRLGVSCYELEVLLRVQKSCPIGFAQIPGNALDQRVAAASAGQLGGVELHIRSAFLQGLLLMPEEKAVAKLPAAAEELRRWHGWLSARKADALEAALSLVKGLPNLGCCVVGVENQAQLKAIVEAWRRAQPVSAPELASTRLDVVDPRAWRVSS
jgi:aryl-alcohol dehydrogenase-like predicted oxidoreductase